MKRSRSRAVASFVDRAIASWWSCMFCKMAVARRSKPVCWNAVITSGLFSTTCSAAFLHSSRNAVASAAPKASASSALEDCRTKSEMTMRKESSARFALSLSSLTTIAKKSSVISFRTCGSASARSASLAASVAPIMLANLTLLKDAESFFASRSRIPRYKEVAAREAFLALASPARFRPRSITWRKIVITGSMLASSGFATDNSSASPYWTLSREQGASRADWQCLRGRVSPSP